MRKYQPLWNAIKVEGSAVVAAPAEAHRRIILATRKEKTKDIAWKLECLEAGKKYKLLEKVDGSTITFTLERISTLSYVNLSVNDL